MNDCQWFDKIEKLEAELQEEIKNNGYSKRATFLQATINVYRKKTL